MSPVYRLTQRQKQIVMLNFVLHSLAVLRLQDSEGIHDLGYPQVLLSKSSCIKKNLAQIHFADDASFDANVGF